MATRWTGWTGRAGLLITLNLIPIALRLCSVEPDLVRADEQASPKVEPYQTQKHWAIGIETQPRE
jgi:hypothetical protein